MLIESLSLYFDLQGRNPSELESTNENAKRNSELSLSLTALLSGSVMAGPAAISVVDVHYLSDDSMVPSASSKLVRTNRGVSMTTDTNDLDSGAYTNWWIIFNNPGECTNPIPAIGAACGLPDLDDPLVEASVLYATGNVVDEDGEGGFGAHLKMGDTDGALFGPGLLNPRGAEIHILVRHHGPVIPAMMPSQIMTVAGGCNPCTDLQAAAHSP